MHDASNDSEECHEVEIEQFETADQIQTLCLIINSMGCFSPIPCYCEITVCFTSQVQLTFDFFWCIQHVVENVVASLIWTQ
ncbi:hypothetical protein ECANGB1_852 [Enterospora canceri]|uniref:Uncharacterized protein n=1 Tax=Enterospora canceri TaxID=1081671 RepID=A0A1Y1S783_9MICR|nr:hypothetical protein ECANGB1_852 [Enterospora canceri]